MANPLHQHGGQSETFIWVGDPVGPSNETGDPDLHGRIAAFDAVHGRPVYLRVSGSRGVTEIVSANASIAVNDVVYWMADGRFLMYDGTMREIRCDVKEYVFDRIDRTQFGKVAAGHNARYNEVWWFYQSTSGSECDSYVIYNYAQDIWYYGSLNRTAWLSGDLYDYPVAAETNGKLYFHEFGVADGTQNPPVGLDAYIESTQQDIKEGNDFMFINRIIPDVTFRNSTTSMPMGTLTLKVREYPGGGFSQQDDGTVTQTATSPVEAYTNQIFVRLRGRSVVLRMESDDQGTAWRLGNPRIEVRMDGLR